MNFDETMKNLDEFAERLAKIKESAAELSMDLEIRAVQDDWNDPDNFNAAINGLRYDANQIENVEHGLGQLQEDIFGMIAQLEERDIAQENADAARDAHIDQQIERDRHESS